MNNSHNKKILFVINNLSRGGAERQFVNQINFLNEKGYTVYLLTLFKEDKKNSYLSELKVNKKNIIFIDFKNIFNIKIYFILEDFLKNEKIKIIYSTLDYANTIARLFKILNPRIRLFIRESNVAYKKPLKFKFTDLFLNWLPERIIVVSDEIKKSLEKYQWIYKNKIVTVNNGVIMPYINHGQKKPEVNETIEILNVGRLKKQKGQLYLLEAFHDLIKSGNNNLHLSIIGDGSLKNELEEYVSSNKLLNNVSLLGLVSDDKLLGKYYEKSDIFILSSLWEGCPNVLLEAMSYGIPCISTLVGGAEDVIEEGKSGFLINPANTDQLKERINILIKDKNLRNLIGRNARKKIEDDFSIDKQMSNLIKILNI